MIRIERALLGRMAEAFAIVSEYYEAVEVVVREDAAEFGAKYFGPGAGIWLARDGAAVVGCIALRPLKEMAGCGEVKRLYVKPAYRGQGIAERLLEALEAFARASGYEAIYLDSKDDLKAALRFYARHGYVECARYNENPQATVFMRKVLGRKGKHP